MGNLLTLQMQLLNRKHLSIILLILFLLVTSVQAGAVMADFKHVDPYRGWHDGSAGQPDLCSCHCGVYIRCDGTAVIPRRIYS